MRRLVLREHRLCPVFSRKMLRLREGRINILVNNLLSNRLLVLGLRLNNLVLSLMVLRQCIRVLRL